MDSEGTLADLVHPGFYDEIVLIGFPHDEGARRAGLRNGANLGPDSFRRFLGAAGQLYNIQFGVDLSEVKLCDYGNIIPATPSLPACYEKLATKTALALSRKLLPVIIGGSRDYVPAAADAFLKQFPKNSCIICVTPCLDMQPLLDTPGFPRSIHRQLLLKQPGLLHLFAVQGCSCSKAQASEKSPKGMSLNITTLKTLRDSQKAIGQQFCELLEGLKKDGIENFYLSFNLESVHSAEAPGVTSAISMGGLSAAEALEIARVAGASLKDKLKLVDLSEYNPMAQDYRTGRLCTSWLYYLLLGLKG